MLLDREVVVAVVTAALHISIWPTSATAPTAGSRRRFPRWSGRRARRGRRRTPARHGRRARRPARRGAPPSPRPGPRRPSCAARQPEASRRVEVHVAGRVDAERGRVGAPHRREHAVLRLNARVNASWLAKPLSRAMSRIVRSVASMRCAARSRRIRRRKRAGDSPAIARATRSSCDRDSPAGPPSRRRPRHRRHVDRDPVDEGGEVVGSGGRTASLTAGTRRDVAVSGGRSRAGRALGGGRMPDRWTEVESRGAGWSGRRGGSGVRASRAGLGRRRRRGRWPQTTTRGRVVDRARGRAIIVM